MIGRKGGFGGKKYFVLLGLEYRCACGVDSYTVFRWYLVFMGDD